MNDFNKKEFSKLCLKYSGSHIIQKKELRIESKKYFLSLANSINNDRRGEVVFCVIKDKKIITIRSSEYPEGVFRIPTGGINYGEDIKQAVIREVKEELGVKANITSFEGVIKWTFSHRKKHVNFYSYLFILEYESGALLVDALEDEVSEVKLCTRKELNGISNYLLTLQSFWDDWGRFRYETTNFAYISLNKNNK